MYQFHDLTGSTPSVTVLLHPVENHGLLTTAACPFACSWDAQATT